MLRPFVITRASVLLRLLMMLGQYWGACARFAAAAAFAAAVAAFVARACALTAFVMLEY